MVALALGAVGWLIGVRIPGIALTHSIAERMICAVRLAEDCRNEPALRAAHGADVATQLRAHAPALLYEDGMRALPVDFRRCRADHCAAGAAEGAVSRSNDGERTVAFTHVIDCRPGRIAATRAWGGNCLGQRVGNLYLQYWLYYPGSATAEGSTPLKGTIRVVSTAIGHPSHHPDDWESYQLRIGPSGRFARASSHRRHNGWTPEGDNYYISGGSHAGRPLPRLASQRSLLRVRYSAARSTKDHSLILIPLETLSGRDSYRFAVTPPWRKRVYFDPEYSGTD